MTSSSTSSSADMNQVTPQQDMNEKRKINISSSEKSRKRERNGEKERNEI